MTQVPGANPQSPKNQEPFKVKPLYGSLKFLLSLSVAERESVLRIAAAISEDPEPRCFAKAIQTASDLLGIATIPKG